MIDMKRVIKIKLWVFVVLLSLIALSYLVLILIKAYNSPIQMTERWTDLSFPDKTTIIYHEFHYSFHSDFYYITLLQIPKDACINFEKQLIEQDFEKLQDTVFLKEFDPKGFTDTIFNGYYKCYTADLTEMTYSYYDKEKCILFSSTGK